MFRFTLFFMSLFILSVSCQKKQENKTPRIFRENQKELIAKAKAFDTADAIDSAYVYFLQSLKIDIKYRDSLGIAKTHVNLMALEQKMNDYPSSEARAAFLVKYGKSHGQPMMVCDAYNYLGLNALSQQKYEEALRNFADLQSYYQAHSTEMDTTIYYSAYYNNTANVYAAMKDYSISNGYYKVLTADDSLKKYDPLTYARALDNSAKNLLDDGKPDQAFPILQKVFHIRQQDSVPSALVMSEIHFAQYYLMKNDFQKATQWAKRSLKNCEDIHNVHDALTTLQLLSKSDPENATVYFERYAVLKDSILKVERNFKDQNARVRLETQEKEQLIVQQTHKLRQNIFIFIAGTVFLILSIVSAIIFFKQRNKIKKQKTVVEKQLVLIQSLQEEMHHRVKNNLEKVLSFIDQKKDLQPEFSNDLTNRINSMLIIHKQLLKQPSHSQISIQDYYEEISNHVNQTYSYQHKNIETHILSPVVINYKEALLLGLLLNELLTNSYKYAFTEQDKGSINIEMYPENDSYILIYQDNGVGLPLDFDLKNVKSYGMNLIKGLVLQMNGTMIVEKPETGVKFLIKLFV